MTRAFITALLLSFLPALAGSAQEPEKPVAVNIDLVSSFVWRGTKIGNGPALQPTLEFSAGGLTIGSWGSYYFGDPFLDETDLYAGFSFPFGLSLGFNDYYFTPSSFFTHENHALELNGGYERGHFKVSANCIVNEGAGSAGGDLYFELGYTTGPVSFFAGAGNGWHTTDHLFNVCNLGISAIKEIKVNDSITIPLTGSLIMNPETGKLFIVAALTL